MAPLARVVHISVLGHDPVVMLDAPWPATHRALQRALDADLARMNVHGGAIALGHPRDASGAKLMTTLVNALRRGNGRLGLQTMCEGGGMANVTIIERC